MFKVNNKETWTYFTPCPSVSIETYFTPCPSVSIVGFEQMNAGWGENKVF